MNKFNIIKTVQLILMALLTIAALLTVFLNEEVYTAIAGDPGVRILGIFLWIVLGLSFVFLYYDFHSYAGLRRENTELDNAIYSDALTGIANRYSMDVYIEQFHGKPLPADMGCITLDLTNLNEINKNCGHSAGDEAIQEFSGILQKSADGNCMVGRNGGNKFLAIFRDCTRLKLDTFLQRVQEQVEEYNQKNKEKGIRYCSGVSFEEGDQADSLNDLVALSDRRAMQAGSLSR